MFHLYSIDLTQVGGGAVVLYVTYLLLKEVVPMVMRRRNGNVNGEKSKPDPTRVMVVDVIQTLLLPILAGQTKILDELRLAQVRQTEILLLLQQSLEHKEIRNA